MTTKKETTGKAQENLEAVAEAQKKSIEAAVKNGTEAFTKGYEKIYSASREQFDKANQSAFKNYDQFAEFNRETFDAMVVSGNVVAKGFEIVSKEVAAYAQKSAEANIAAAKRLSSVKNVQEAIDLQTSWAKESFDSFMAESAKLQDLSMKVANEAGAPINERINAAVEKLTKSVAA